MTDDEKALCKVVWAVPSDQKTMKNTARAILASDWLAQRDARTRAEALREAADVWRSAQTHRPEDAPPGLVETWLRVRASRFEPEAVTQSDGTADDNGYAQSPEREGR